MAIKETITVQEIVDKLNEFMDLDKRAMIALVYERLPCNIDLAAHSELQVMQNQDGSFSMGLLGVLNGILGIHEKGPADGFGAIVLTTSDDDTKKPEFKVVQNNFEFMSLIGQAGSKKG